MVPRLTDNIEERVASLGSLSPTAQRFENISPRIAVIAVSARLVFVSGCMILIKSSDDLMSNWADTYCQSRPGNGKGPHEATLSMSFGL
jgi:hypothetical protein